MKNLINQNNMKQTAVEWLVEQIHSEQYQIAFGQTYLSVELVQQAKQIEKEQIKYAFVECWKANVPDGIECKLDAEQYYNETFKSE